jgi:hypothetical protein
LKIFSGESWNRDNISFGCFLKRSDPIICHPCRYCLVGRYIENPLPQVLRKPTCAYGRIRNTRLLQVILHDGLVCVNYIRGKFYKACEGYALSR